MKKEQQVEQIVLFGYKINLHSDKVEIYNDKGVPFFDFKGEADRLIQYLIDEAFIEKQKVRVEIISPPSSDCTK